MHLNRLKLGWWSHLLLCLCLVLAPFTARAGEAVFYYHNDATGSPVAITNSAGTVVWKADYEPFGELAGLVENVPNPQQFLAKTVDPETSLHLLGARYYDGKMGRFLSVDPALLQGRQASQLGRSQFLNPYSYSINNPYRFSDPTGNTPIDLIFLAVDVARFGVAVYTGDGVGAAAIDVGLSLAGVVSPIAGTGEALKVGRAADHALDAVKGLDTAGDATRAVLPKNPDDLLNQGYREVSHPNAAEKGHRSFENPETGDKLRFDKGDPSEKGMKARDQYHRENSNTTGKQDKYLDKDGNPCRDGCRASHLFPGD
ncbi:MAG: exported protein of unknown function [Nitrospira sp.]|nr:MAG: exported protein of unknown function [Nitrospira sp.]